MRILGLIVAWVVTIAACYFIVWSVDEVKKEEYRDECDKERWLDDARDIEQEQNKARSEDEEPGFPHK